LRHGNFTILRVAQLDKPGVFREAARVDKEWNPVAVIYLAGPADILHRDGLPGGGIVGDGGHSERDAVRSNPPDEVLQPFQVHVALERQVGLGVIAFRDGQVNRIRAKHEQVRLGRVKMAVVRHYLAGFDQRLEQHAFRRPALMGWQDVRKAEHFLHRAFKMREAARAGIRLIPAHYSRPLRITHRAGAAVGQQVHEHVFRWHGEQVVVRFRQRVRALLRGSNLQLLNNFDTKWFDKRDGHGLSFKSFGLLAKHA